MSLLFSRWPRERSTRIALPGRLGSRSRLLGPLGQRHADRVTDQRRATMAESNTRAGGVKRQILSCRANRRLGPLGRRCGQRRRIQMTVRPIRFRPLSLLGLSSWSSGSRYAPRGLGARSPACPLSDHATTRGAEAARLRHGYGAEHLHQVLSRVGVPWRATRCVVRSARLEVQ